MNQQPDNKAEIPLLTQHFEISAVVRPALIDDERPFYGLAGRGALQLLRVIAEAVAQIGFKAAAARMVLCVVPGPFPYRDTSRSTFVAFVILRSEEHTSELQSLMRISYAVFCLKTKQITNTNLQT